MISAEGCWLSNARALRGWCVDDNTLRLWHRTVVAVGVSAVNFRAKQSRSSSCCLRISKVIETYLGEPVQGEELLFTCHIRTNGQVS